MEPQVFCAGCANKLKMTHLLKQKCVETQSVLEEFLKNEEREASLPELENELKEEPEIDYLIEEVDDEMNFDREPTPEIKYEELEVLEETPKTSQDRDSDINRGRYECIRCPAFYRTRRGLRDHYQNVHPDDKIHECPHCKNKFFSFFIDEHIQTCKKAKTPSVCPVCGIIVAKKHISRHIESHKFSNKDRFDSEKPFQCDICGVRTVAKCGLVSHMQVQHLNHRVRCEVCFTEFKTPSVLSSHIRKYHPEKKSPLKCKFCEFTATDASVMRRHHLYHTGKKRHKCEECGREFRAKDVLRDHMTTHSDERPFPCTVCKSSFKTRKALGVHMKTHRAHEYECPVCQKTYLTNQQMRNHVKRAHPDYELPPPGTIFNKNWRIRKAREEMKEMAIKEGVDTAVVESIVIEEPPPIETKMYIRTNYVNVDRIEEI